MRTTGPDRGDLLQAAHALSCSIGRFNASNFTQLDKAQNKHIKNVLEKALDAAYDLMEVLENHVEQGEEDDERGKPLQEDEDE